MLPPAATLRPMTDGKQELHAKITEDAHARFHAFADLEGITVTSFLEELSDYLGDPVMFEIAVGARKIAADRRRRNNLS